MNILFYHKNGIYPTSGGISKITCNLTSLFRDKGHNVFYLANRPIKDKNYVYDEEQFFLPNEHLDAPENYLFIENLIKSNKIQYIINQCPFDTGFLEVISRYKSKYNFKIISCYHNSIITPIRNYAFQKEWFWKKWKKLLFLLLKQYAIQNILVNSYILRNRNKYKKTYELSDSVIVLCGGLKKELLKMIGLRDSSKIDIIPNFNSTNLQYDRRKDNEVLWIGTTDFQTKRLDFMLDVWCMVHENNPDWKLKILGDGSALSIAKEFVQNENITNVSFEGRVNPVEYIQKSKIICVTSSHEAFPMVILEGLCGGLYPVVNNSFPAASMLIKNQENGSLVKAFSRAEFAKELNRVMNSPLPSPESLAASVEKYSPEQAYQNWMALFDSLK